MTTATTADSSPYRGRFAPSPTGPLHFGSLVAAVGSYLQARHRGGEWWVRMEDVDRPRTVHGADTRILEALERHGLTWDGPVLYQSQRDEAYAEALEQLRHERVLYPCGCSRKEIAEASGGSGIYPGTCRRGMMAERRGRALRVNTEGALIRFEDLLQGPRQQALEREVGDFVVRRADGLYAYQLAVVVDDAAQGITEVVRGSDLLDSTPRQIHLQRLLGLPTPSYLHLPVAVNRQGEKLSKQTHAPPLDLADPMPALWRALVFLGQQPPEELREADPPTLLQWAIDHWEPARLPPRETIPCP